MIDARVVAKEREFPHPGWQPISRVVNLPGPLSESCLFMPSYSDFTSHIYILKGEYLTVVDPGNDYTAYYQQLEKSQLQKCLSPQRLMLFQL